jgi:asparagine synthetase B (glutamine-hydrolysing)
MILPADVLNPDYFRRFLVGFGFVESWVETPIKGISRVPRGRALTFTKSMGQPVVSFTDSLVPSAGLDLLSEDELCEAYRGTVMHAVSRCRGKGALFELSGGWDSTALVIANSLTSHAGDAAVTNVWNNIPGVVEEINAQRVASWVEIPWYSVALDDCGPMSHLLTERHQPDEPSPDMFIYPWEVSIFKLAQELGYERIICGLGADDLFLGASKCVLADLLRQWRIKEAWEEATSLASRYEAYGVGAKWFLKAYGLLPLLGVKQSPPIPALWDPSIHGRFRVPSFMVANTTHAELVDAMEATLRTVRLDSIYQTHLARHMLATIDMPVHRTLGRVYGACFCSPYLERPVVEFVLGV